MMGAIYERTITLFFNVVALKHFLFSDPPCVTSAFLVLVPVVNLVFFVHLHTGS